MKDERQSTSIYEKAVNPALQALIIFAVVLIIMLGTKLINWTAITEISNESYWLTATSFMLFFALFNSVFSLWHLQYWLCPLVFWPIFSPLYRFMMLVHTNGFMSYLFLAI